MSEQNVNSAPGEVRESLVLADGAPAPAPVSTATSAAARKPPYPTPASVPTQEGPRGIRYDFNLGARVLLPPRESGKWRVRLRDLDTGNTLFQSENTGALVMSSKRFYVRFGIEVWDVDPAGTAELVFEHAMELRDRPVLVQFPIGTLGDIMAWFSYAPRFAAVHGCRMTIAMSGLIIPLLRDAYPEVDFVTHEELVDQALPARAYATYCIGLFFDDADCVNQPTDFRHVGLHRTAGYILGVDPTEEAPRLALPDESRPIDEPYVCIAVQATTASKMWNNPNGWREVIAFLKAHGYRVICIDQKPVHGAGIVWNHLPHGAEDETGDRPLAERARWLRHCAAFVGLSSGLSWLAWAAGAPTVMISGFSHPDNEFATPYRVVNWHACNSCWNDVRHRFDHHDYLWCPRHANTPRQFECTRLITGQQVIAALKRMPGLIGGEQPLATPAVTPPASGNNAAGIAAELDRLRRMVRRQLFFVGGAPRSGTTWLQFLLDAHPAVTVAGEGFFLKHLAEPLDAMLEERRKSMAAKNGRVFGNATRYHLPDGADADLLLGTAMLRAMEAQAGDRQCAAIGEKTPENVFLFERVKRIFPAAKFIGIVRDPRDVLTSAWHYFHKPAEGEDVDRAKLDFIRSARPSLDNGTRTMLGLAEKFPGDCEIITYERLLEAPAEILGRLYRFLGVSDDVKIVSASLERASFAALSGGRRAGEEQVGAFFRKGVAGDWRGTLNEEMNRLILDELGWMFPRFGWEAE